MRCTVLKQKTAQHSVHPTGGSLRVFRQFAWLEVGSVKVALSRPTHQRVTQTVRRQNIVDNLRFQTDTMKITGFDGLSLSLTILGYEFSELKDTLYDSNFLSIQIDVESPQGSWM